MRVVAMEAVMVIRTGRAVFVNVNRVDGGLVVVSYCGFNSWQNGRSSGGMGAADSEWLAVVLAVDEVLIVGGEWFLRWEL